MIIAYHKPNYIKTLFLLFIVAASITGIGYYLFCITHGIIQYTTYTDNIMDTAGIFPSIIRYSKDVLMVLLFCLIILKKYPKLDKFLLLFILFIVYGASISFVNNLTLTHIIAGTRSFIYFITGILFFRSFKLDRKYVDLLYKTTTILLIAQLFSIILIVFISGVNNIGNGSYRYVGLFLHTGTLGNYAYAIAIFLATYHLKYRTFKLTRTLFEQVICFLLAVASNSRLCIAGIIVNMLIVTMSLINLKQKTRDLTIIGTVLVFLPFVLSEVLARSGRGGLTASASGKLAFWEQAFSRKIINVLFGNGLGYATQTTVILGINNSGYSGFDGTFSVIMAQFGVIGLAFFVMCFIGICITILKCPRMKNMAFKINIVCGLCLFTWSGNIFENILLIIYYLLVYSILEKC